MGLLAHHEFISSNHMAQAGHGLAPTGQDLVRVGLVTHVPHQAIVWRVEDVVQRDGQFDGAERRGEVPAVVVRERLRLAQEDALAGRVDGPGAPVRDGEGRDDGVAGSVGADPIQKNRADLLDRDDDS